jgi:hypothetical protein
VPGPPQQRWYNLLCFYSVRALRASVTFPHEVSNFVLKSRKKNKSINQPNSRRAREEARQKRRKMYIENYYERWDAVKCGKVISANIS